MTDLRERALAALSGACWPDEAEYLKGLMRMETALRDARAAVIREADGKIVDFSESLEKLPMRTADGQERKTLMLEAVSAARSAILAFIEKE